MTTHEKTEWLRVTKGNHCPICDHDSWCVVAADGNAAICMREPSAKVIEMNCGTGYLHKLNPDAPAAPRRPIAPKKATTPPPVADWPAFARQHAAKTSQSDIAELSKALGVTAESLARMGAMSCGLRRTPDGDYAQAWGFPMYSAGMEIIGIRLRTSDGRKFAAKGSHSGLFVPDAGIPEQLQAIVVTEGPTDCAAVLDMGHYAIGRPSCSGSVPETVQLCRGLNVTILADRDSPKPRPDGTTWKPGQVGAEALADALHGQAKSVRLIYPSTGKDARQWLQAGGTEAVLSCVIRNALTWKRRK